MKRLEMYYHEKTKTTWVNDSAWEERRKTENMGYGTIEVNIDNIFEMKSYMESNGYHMVKNNPFGFLNQASEILERSECDNESTSPTSKG